VIGYLTRIWRLRHFWLALVRADLRSRYRRSVLGVGWSLLHPIAMTIVLCTVFATIFQFDVRNYAPFVLAGLVLWNFIVAVTSGGCQCFFQGEPYIRQHPAPLAIYPLRTTLGAGIHFLLGMVVVLLLAWGLRGFSNLPALVSLVPTILLLFIFGWSLAVCAGVINVMFQDTQHLVEVALQVVFYVTPIIYTASLLRDRHLAWAVGLNPLAAFLDLIRGAVLDGSFPLPQSFAVAGVTTAVAAAVAILILDRMERRIIFYL
jgi:ABC-type polysaccharide/polyol phosphate export permease